MTKYHYTECGLDNVWLNGGVELHDTPYGKGTSIPDIDGLHRLLGKMLVEKPGRLTGAEFRFLRIELGFSRRLTAQWLSMDGDNAFETIKKWEEARTEAIRGANDRIIRAIYRKTILDEDVDYMEIAEYLRTTDCEYHERLELAADDGGWREAC